MKTATLSLCALIFLALPALAAEPSLGQGIMAGRVTDTSAILQARLTLGKELIGGDLPGCAGLARFALSKDKDFSKTRHTEWIEAKPENDYIVKLRVTDLEPATRYFYRLEYGVAKDNTKTSRICTLRTHGGAGDVSETSLAIVTGMNYFFFQEGAYKPETAYQGEDKALGYPALASIKKHNPDFFVGTGDTVYFDHPAKRDDRWTGTAWSDRARTEPEMRRKYHEQFVQPRFAELFADTPTYWEVDDHEYRFNDCDNSNPDVLPTPAMGEKSFKEQLPVVDPGDPNALTYGTFRISRDLQIWIVEGRLYRSPNKMEDGPEKTIWGAEQKAWLKQTLLDSDATIKLLISPTPMIGVDGKGKRDSHVNLAGFRNEGDEFFRFLDENGFDDKNLYIVCGDRHWQYHAVHPAGIHEFSTGALVDANSRYGVKGGTEKSTDPEGLVEQRYCMLPGVGEPSGGYLIVTVTPEGKSAKIKFGLYDENGKNAYSYTAKAK